MKNSVLKIKKFFGLNIENVLLLLNWNFFITIMIYSIFKIFKSWANFHYVN